MVVAATAAWAMSSPAQDQAETTCVHFHRFGSAEQSRMAGYIDDFNAANAVDYVNQAQRFLRNSPAGTLTKVRANGDVVRYNSKTDRFGVMDATGAPRTFFKPDPSVHGHKTNLYCLHAQ
jgi:pyocin large subunit-like protein